MTIVVHSQQHYVTTGQDKSGTRTVAMAGQFLGRVTNHSETTTCQHAVLHTVVGGDKQLARMVHEAQF